MNGYEIPMIALYPTKNIVTVVDETGEHKSLDYKLGLEVPFYFPLGPVPQRVPTIH